MPSRCRTPTSVGPVAVDPLGFVAVNTETQTGDDKITGIVPNGVITSRGIIRVDGHLIYEGETDYVKSVDIRTGTVLLGRLENVQKVALPKAWARRPAPLGATIRTSIHRKNGTNKNKDIRTAHNVKHAQK